MNTIKTKENDAGIMHTTSSWWITCYDLFTNAWFYRGGKIYDADKKYVILSGNCELTIEKKWKDITKTISPDNGIFEIASWTPHIFYFPEDTRMIEWFLEGANSSDFERYRAMKK